MAGGKRRHARNPTAGGPRRGAGAGRCRPVPELPSFVSPTSVAAAFSSSSSSGGGRGRGRGGARRGARRGPPRTRSRSATPPSAPAPRTRTRRARRGRWRSPSTPPPAPIRPPRSLCTRTAQTLPVGSGLGSTKRTMPRKRRLVRGGCISGLDSGMAATTKSRSSWRNWRR
ncbi:hypothetical protein ACP70R_045896 [Stipagrostis hirtigluma subsp. patula]